MKKQIKKISFAMYFLLYSLVSFSQQTFKGTIVEEDTKTPVTNAIVAIENTALAETTNNNGEFTFSNNVPIGEHVVTVSKPNYDTKFLLIEVFKNKNVYSNQIHISVNKKERKRREKALKQKEKERKKLQKENEKKLKEAQKEKEKEEKELEKKKKKLQKEKKKNKTEEIPIVYEETNSSESNIDNNLKIKYGAILNTDPNQIQNKKLYEFIDQWMGTTYLLGGETRDGIDCSSFTQRFYIKVYDMYIERTAEKQFKSKLTDKFQGKEYLQEGDLIFFKGSGELSNTISHVGIYLQNNKFVHATAYTRDTGSKGVKISDLTDSFWVQRFVAGGRRTNL